MKRREARKGGQTLRVHPPGVDAGLSKSIRAVPRMLLTFTAAPEQRLPVRSDQHVPPRGGRNGLRCPVAGTSSDPSSPTSRQLNTSPSDYPTTMCPIIFGWSEQ